MVEDENMRNLPNCRAQARRAVWIASGLACAAVLAVSANASEPQRFVIIGDTQSTLLVERLIGREVNSEATRKLVAAAVKEQPAAILHLGDFVGNAMYREEWQTTLSYFAPFPHAQIFLALGNHDHWGFDSWSLANVYEFFPDLQRSHWYVKRFGDLAFVVLDSNEWDLGATRWSEQKNWLAATLKQLDGDDGVRHVLLAAHHPPETASRTVPPHRPSREAFRPLFVAARKTAIYFSGHAHGHERYHLDGKLFVVSGGGGGPRQQHDPSAANEFRAADPHPFHYLIMTETADGQLHFEVKGFQSANEEVRELDRF